MANQSEYSDEYVAKLMKQDAEASSIKYSALGLQAFLPKRPTGAAPKPNTRFLKNLLRETDTHNAALLAKAQREAKSKQKELPLQEREDRHGKRHGKSRDEERDRKRRRVDRSDDSELEERRDRRHRRREHRSSRASRSKRLDSDDYKRDHRIKRRRSHSPDGVEAAREKTDRKERRRSRSREPESRKESDRHRSRRHHRKRSATVSASSRSSSREPRRRDRHRSSRKRSPSTSLPRSTSADNDKRAAHLDRKEPNKRPSPPQRKSSPRASDSDPLEAVVGPLPPPPPPKVRKRGRGVFSSSSTAIDSHFASGYDPSTDVLPDSDTDDDWDMALEALRDRQKWHQQGADRLRAAGFTEEEVRKWEKGGAKDESDVKWAKSGEGREWDRGKVVADDGDVELKPEWGRLKGT